MLLLVPLVFAWAACSRDDTGRAPRDEVAEGRAIIITKECGACHVIPNVPAAWGRVGPTLAGFRGRVYLAGRIPNTPDELERWLLDPPRLVPGTAMPNLNLAEHEVRAVAAYLYTLQ
jgi:cytochrome c